MGTDEGGETRFALPARVFVSPRFDVDASSGRDARTPLLFAIVRPVVTRALLFSFIFIVPP